MRLFYTSIFFTGVLLLAGCNLGTTPIPEPVLNTPAAPQILIDSPTDVPFSSVTQAVTVVSNSATQDNTTEDAPCTARTEWESYTVERGDNLTGIASRVRSTTAELIAANCLEDPDTIRIGQTLYIPPQSNTTSGSSQPVIATTGGRTRIYIDNAGFAFDYPAEWILTQASSGPGGGLVATYRFDEIPAAAAPWPDAFIGVQFTPFPETIAGDDLEAWAETTMADYEAAERIEVISALQEVKLESGLVGYVFATEGAGAPTRHYFLDIEGQFVVFEVTGQPSSLSDAVINSVRPA